MQATRPDLAHAVSTISKFNNNYDERHWTVVKRIFRYLQKTKDLRLRYSKDGNRNITGYCDASWASDPEDSRSITGFIFTLQGGAICWNSRRQSTTALSSIEAEYLSLTEVAKEALWLNRFAQELLIVQKQKPLTIFCDKGAIDLTKNSRYSHLTRHIKIRHSFIKERIASKEIEVKFLPSTQMMADAVTKATWQQKLQEFIESAGLVKKDQEVKIF